MESETFPVYRHSGKFFAHGPIAGVAVAVIAGFPLGYAYGYIMKWIPFIYLNFLVTLGYGFFFGVVTGALMKWGKVRNTPVVVVMSLLAGGIALYFSWNGHIHSLFPDAPILCGPDEMLNGMKALYKEGSWGLRGSGPVTGIPLAIVWVVEAAMILGLTTVTAVGMITSTPFCENAMCWLDKKRTINTLALFTDPAQVAAIKGGDLRPLTQARPKPVGADSWTRLTLKYSPSTEALYTVRLENIRRHVQKDGKIKEVAESLTGDLIVPKSMFELMSKFQKFKDPSAPPDEPEEPEPQAAGGTPSPQV